MLHISRGDTFFIIPVINASSDMSVSVLYGKKHEQNTGKYTYKKLNLLACKTLVSYQPMTLEVCLNAPKKEEKKNYEAK